ncbi:hypothetical protein QG37_01070 [Candidozyma auris]|uniref:Uncharacterized protein n=1 Tax=Candidozyma auris TaxID=498019 RepID=A0A0L0P616_CANAR|nr:hypothetical protein QG37_01070 [[Candida] auris]
MLDQGSERIQSRYRAGTEQAQSRFRVDLNGRYEFAQTRKRKDVELVLRAENGGSEQSGR